MNKDKYLEVFAYYMELPIISFWENSISSWISSCERKIQWYLGLA